MSLASSSESSRRRQKKSKAAKRDDKRGKKEKKSKKNDKKDKKDRKKKKKKKKEKSKKRKRERSLSSTSSSSSSEGDDDVGDGASGNSIAKDFVEALQSMLASFPALVSDFPLFLMQLSAGETLNLSQVPQEAMRNSLSIVFSRLSPFSLREKAPLEFQWAAAAKAGSKVDDFALIRIVDSLLDEVGLTLGAVAEFDMVERQRQASEAREKKVTAEKAARRDGAKGGWLGPCLIIRFVTFLFAGPPSFLSFSLSNKCNAPL